MGKLLVLREVFCLKKEITLISQGRISKKDFSAKYQYYDADGNKLEFPDEGDKGKDINFQPSTKYYKVRGYKRGDVIYRSRIKNVYALNGFVAGTRDGNREYHLTQTIYINSDLDKIEAENFLKRVWNENTDFAPYSEFLEEDDIEDIPDEDTFLIKSTYQEDGRERKYTDKAKAKVTLKSITLKDFIQQRAETGQNKNYGTKAFRRKKIED